MAINQNKAFKDQLLIVESSLVGIKDRGVGTPNTAVVGGSVIDFHPMVRDRNNWGTIDPVRGLLASYYAEYNSSKGPTLYNYRTLVDYVDGGGEITEGPYDGGTNGIGRLNRQLDDPAENTNIVLTAEFPGNDQSPVTFGRRVSAWKSYDAAPYSWYKSNFKEYIQGPGITITSRVNSDEATYNGLLNGSLNTPYFDHTSNYYLFSPIKEIRQESGLTTNVEPVYNYYVNSNPDYEDVTKKLQEYLIPNAYYLQLELQNTSSTFLAPHHKIAITMDGMVPWFNTTGLGNALETNEGVYYNLYSDNMVSWVTPTDPSVIKNSNGDTAILYSDLAVLSENSIIDESLPFYNKITIGYDEDSVGATGASGRLIETLLGGEDTKDFVDILQAYAIMKHAGNAGSTTEFSNRQRRLVSAESGDYTLSTTNTDYKELFTIEVDDPAFIDAGSLSGIEAGPNHIENNYGVRFLRDYFGKTGDGELELDAASGLFAFIQLFMPSGEPAPLLNSLKRTLFDVYENKSCHTETLMYIVEKYRGPPDDEDPVQTFYISPKYIVGNGFSTDTVYYDTQIRYNQKYTYVFKKIVLVFGNEYRYTNLNFFDSNRAFNLSYENKLSIKALVVPYSFEGLSVSVIDKPPVSPDLSFYPAKGVGSSVKILLNSSTGDYFDKPIRILDSDKQFIEEEYFGQTGMSASYEEIRTQNKKIRYKSDDLVDKYQLFRINSAPTSYRDFNNQFVEIDPDIGVVGYYEDAIETNRKYYYCARSVDIHDNISNPTYIFELEMVDNDGQIYLRQNVFTFKQSKPTYLKDGRRFIYIEPSFQQVALDTEVAPPDDVSELPTNSILGVSDIDTVWTKSYKLRVTSKKTGKKMDLNLTFKNSGVTNPG
jgi:hypothetical protein